MNPNRQANFDQASGGQGDSEIDCLVMFDRTIDMISPFCVQQNYEGQIDENFGISSGYARIPMKIINPSAVKSDGTDPDSELVMRLTNE